MQNHGCFHEQYLIYEYILQVLFCRQFIIHHAYHLILIIVLQRCGEDYLITLRHLQEVHCF